MENQARESETMGSSLYMVQFSLLLRWKLSQSGFYRLGLPYAKPGIPRDNRSQWGVCTIHTDVQRVKGFPGLLNYEKLRLLG
ncbi:hypothetical protein BT93_L0565 [Corymbia citriodora subsp. variegata]|uniref:Uncharacterized protein n=1 Tax=Corymbia citriodora subsp. variegata TaxID=360336 RepID=A0A8T0CQW6_CORYI|nr:hypothetical protein BT93_L0565 [Corymbia citriodora subsp. variegata]